MSTSMIAHHTKELESSANRDHNYKDKPGLDFTNMFTRGFDTLRSQKRKTVKLFRSFCAFWICTCKNCSKNIDEIEPWSHLPTKTIIYYKVTPRVDFINVLTSSFLHTQIPKAQKDSQIIKVFLWFWNLYLRKLLVRFWWNQPLGSI